MKPIILFDIDRTLFDTDGFSQHYRNKFLKFLNLTDTKLENIRAKYHHSLSKHTDYNPEEFIKHVINSLNISKQPKIYEKLHNYYFSSDNFSKNIYPETLNVLKDIKNRYDLGIFSEGLPSFQETKLTKSNLYDFFNPQYIFIHSRKIQSKVLSNLPDHCIIVDDDYSVINELISQTKKPFTPIWLNRKDKSSHPLARTIHSLIELN